MPAPTISVIIPVYNDLTPLPRALASIAAQSLKPTEILICDDGSPQREVWEYLQSLGTQFGGIPLRVFRQKNAGAGAARNRCLAAAQGEFVAFLDSDDWWLPQKLERSVAVLQQTGATFVAHDFYAVDMDGTQTLWPCAQSAARKDWISRGNLRTHYFYRGFIGILTVVMRREALLAAHGFDSSCRYALDWECWHAVMAATPGAFFHVFAEPLACYTLNPQGLTSKGFARLAERESYIARYVKGVARAGGVPWPLLALRGWLTIQYETLHLVLRNRQWGNLLRLVVRAPFALCRVLWQTATSCYTRPDFLGSLKEESPAA